MKKLSKKIFLSPSNQTENAYAYGGTNEAIQCGRIAEALKSALIRNGFLVMVSHMDTLAEKCSKSNSWGADLHIPIHTNAYNGQVSGTRMFYYSTTGESYKACQAIFNALAPVTPGTSENIKDYRGLYEMNSTNAPSVYIEVDFHDVPSVAKWIIENTELIAESICKGICNYYGVAYNPQSTTPNDTITSLGTDLYRVQVGAYRIRENAEKLLDALKADGYADAFIITIKDYYS